MVPANLVLVNASGAEAAPDGRDIQSTETYIGYKRTDDDFVSPGGVAKDRPHLYKPGAPDRFHSRDLQLVLGPAPDGKPIRFRITIDGTAPGNKRTLLPYQA